MGVGGEFSFNVACVNANRSRVLIVYFPFCGFYCFSLFSGVCSKYFPGKISRARLNGTFDIAYNDGDRETGVARDLIRVVDGGGKEEERPRGRSSGRGGDELEEGMRVEARHGGGR